MTSHTDNPPLIGSFFCRRDFVYTKSQCSKPVDASTTCTYLNNNRQLSFHKITSKANYS